MSLPTAEYNRKILTDVLIYHYRDKSGCGCGWGQGQIEHLGRSWPEHIADVYEESVTARNSADAEG